MNFRKVNNIAGLVVFVIASLVYILTAEMRGSFWDCGEFVSACYKVQLPHPPGAPLFVLLGRFFIVLFGDNPMTAAKAVNVMNAIASGATIMFLFWTITHFARKLLIGSHEEPSLLQTYTVIGAGLVGGLAYTFTDSFWFSAVEGEVYALSSFFTGLAFWSILKWEHANDLAGNDRQLRNRADRWIVFLFFALGLSIGIHLLGLLVIPAAVMVYYYNRYTYSRKGAVIAFIVGCIITGLVQVVVIKWSVEMAGKFDIAFVNSFHLPFFSGFAFFFVLLAALVWFGLRWADKNNWSFLRLGLWCFSFMMLGYSAYLTTMERSNADPSLDMNNVDNPMNLVYYLGREQYGSQPIMYGTHFLAQPTGVEDGKTRYEKGPDGYVELAPDKEYTYDSKDYRLFPRVWDPSNDQRHADYYISWLNLDRVDAQSSCYIMRIGDGVIEVQEENGQPRKYYYDEGFEPAPNAREGSVVYAGQPLAVKIPTYADNIRWFMTYQMGFMYWRYFMWNYSGRQNDIQAGGNRRDGNWITGIAPIDNLRLGDQSKMPASIKDNKAHNVLFLLPFILGIIGCVYQFIKNRQDWIVTFLLFFMTGIAIVIYLNQAGNQPRERDYAFAGSTYAFAIWIGLAVVALVRMARDLKDQMTFKNTVLYSGGLTLIVMLMSDANAING
ncbi:MAG: glycosyltransferase family 117 protein, partial [Flavisolibacter sp.]